VTPCFNFLRKLIAGSLEFNEQVVHGGSVLLMLDGEFDSDQVPDDAHGHEAKFGLLLGLGECDSFLDACPAQFFQGVALVFRGETGDAYGHLIGEHETLDGAVKIGV
jgi:hypothetical protein